MTKQYDDNGDDDDDEDSDESHNLLKQYITHRLIGHKDAVTCVSLKEGTLVSGSR